MRPTARRRPRTTRRVIGTAARACSAAARAWWPRVAVVMMRCHAITAIPRLRRCSSEIWALNLILAIGLITVSLALIGVMPRLTSIEDDAIRLAGAACYAVATWTATFAVIGLALRFLSGFSPARHYIADASYWLYLIQMPIVTALQVAVSRLDWPWPAKFAAILAVAFPLMFASYELLVRHSFIGLVLNGRRAPRRAAMRPEGSIPAFTLGSPTALKSLRPR